MSLRSLARRTGSVVWGAGGTVRFFADLHLTRATPIIVYQMGKVGSSSVKASLKHHGFGSVWGTHRMNPGNIRGVRQAHLAQNQEPPDDMAGQRLYEHIVKKHRRAQLITLVREPIGRNISAFFQNFQTFVGTEWRNAGFTTEDLLGQFVIEYPHSVPLTWFDIEMRKTVGIDVYEHPFPKETGHQTIEQGCFELLIVKLELDDAIKEQAIASFLGIDDFRLVQANVGREKNYAQGYQEFLREIALPQSYVDIMCDSQYLNHFYSEAEIEAIRLRWMDRVHSGELPTAVREHLLQASARMVDGL